MVTRLPERLGSLSQPRNLSGGGPPSKPESDRGIRGRSLSGSLNTLPQTVVPVSKLSTPGTTDRKVLTILHSGRTQHSPRADSTETGLFSMGMYLSEIDSSEFIDSRIP